MKNYIGVKMVKAEPMVASEAGRLLKRTIDITNVDKEGNGYLVEYPDGYKSWSPKEAFEKAYLQIGDNNTIEERNVSDFIKSYDVSQWGDKTTVVHATLANGFVLSESSSCVDPANFNIDIGASICKEKIQNRLWGMLGFLLQTAVKGIK